MILRLRLDDSRDGLQVAWPVVPNVGDVLSYKLKTTVKWFRVTEVAHKFDSQEIEVRAVKVKV